MPVIRNNNSQLGIDNTDPKIAIIIIIAGSKNFENKLTKSKIRGPIKTAVNHTFKE